MAERQRTWVEAALNGPWGKRRHPELPVTVAEIIADGIACVEAGAAILHVHAYDHETGRQTNDWQVYARIIEGIKARVDAIIYPTIPTISDGDEDGVARFSHFDELAKRGLLEWSAVDPGSVNLTYVHSIQRHKPGFLYRNPDAHIQTALALAAQHRLHPSYAIYEPGFLRAGAAFAAANPGAPTPIYRLMFTDGYSFGFPAKPFALDAYLALMWDMELTAPWMIAGLLVDIEPLIEQTVSRGGHIRVGLEDSARDDGRNNLRLVRDGVRAIEAAGASVGNASNVREKLGGDRR